MCTLPPPASAIPSMIPKLNAFQSSTFNFPPAAASSSSSERRAICVFISVSCCSTKRPFASSGRRVGADWTSYRDPGHAQEGATGTCSPSENYGLRKGTSPKNQKGPSSEISDGKGPVLDISSLQYFGGGELRKSVVLPRTKPGGFQTFPQQSTSRFVLNFKTGHCVFQIRPLGLKQASTED
jgi:hypothetical protein